MRVGEAVDAVMAGAFLGWKGKTRDFTGVALASDIRHRAGPGD
jgi:hypothetical protein